MARPKIIKPPVELETLEAELEEDSPEEVEEEITETPSTTPNGLPLQQETFLSHYNPQ
jgi:hypothetical protein